MLTHQSSEYVGERKYWAEAGGLQGTGVGRDGKREGWEEGGMERGRDRKKEGWKEGGMG